MSYFEALYVAYGRLRIGKSLPESHAIPNDTSNPAFLGSMGAASIGATRHKSNVKGANIA